ncbi:hypothetical protein Ccrd_013167 [Cynara cardunculus var. scolymus]|uniref:Uncharacterized protein n=1 Tax=Cynara cardunculus var. scolymus TaxID=59895 RepID=A0A118K529_CYNCS|nr:hypothetical protein Ccrd_013167 [Cynara cardunculus var. scolymus]
MAQFNKGKTKCLKFCSSPDEKILEEDFKDAKTKHKFGKGCKSSNLEKEIKELGLQYIKKEANSGDS